MVTPIFLFLSRVFNILLYICPAAAAGGQGGTMCKPGEFGDMEDGTLACVHKAAARVALDEWGLDLYS